MAVFYKYEYTIKKRIYTPGECEPKLMLCWITLITNKCIGSSRKNIFRKAEETRKLNNFMATVARIRRLHKEVGRNYSIYHIVMFSVIPYMLIVLNIYHNEEKNKLQPPGSISSAETGHCLVQRSGGIRGFHF